MSRPPPFLGIENAPDHPPGHIPHDSPRHHANRNDAAERQLDAHLARLRAAGKQVVRRPDGHVVTLPAHIELKPGWVRLNNSEIDALTLSGPDGERRHSERERIHAEINSGPEWKPERKADEP